MKEDAKRGATEKALLGFPNAGAYAPSTSPRPKAVPEAMELHNATVAPRTTVAALKPLPEHMPAIQGRPKSIISDFYEQFSLGYQLEYSVNLDFEATSRARGKQQYRCELTCPRVTVGGHVFHGNTFVAVAPSWRGAEDAASETALAALHDAGVIPSSAIHRPKALSEAPDCPEGREGVDEICIDSLSLPDAHARLKAVYAELEQVKRELSLKNAKNGTLAATQAI
jgi:hypothetical protein